MDRILVLYGTTEGHTAQIAQAISDTLIKGGFDVDTIQAGSIDPNPAGYAGVVVAGSLHGGQYQTALGQWVRAHVRDLAARPTALVTVCLAVLQKNAKVTADLDAIVGRFESATGWHPTVTKAVAGALLYTKYNFLKRWIMRRIVAKAGGATDTSRDYDYTDWNDLRDFAGEFGRRVAAAG